MSIGPQVNTSRILLWWSTRH